MPLNGDSPLLLLGATGDTCNTTNNDTNMPTNPPPLPLTSERSNPIASFLKQRDLKISKILAGHKRSIIPKSTQLPGQCKCVCACGASNRWVVKASLQGTAPSGAQGGHLGSAKARCGE